MYDIILVIISTDINDLYIVKTDTIFSQTQDTILHISLYKSTK